LVWPGIHPQWYPHLSKMTADFRNQTYGALFVRIAEGHFTLKSRAATASKAKLRWTSASPAAMNQTKAAAIAFAEDADALKQNFLLRGFFFKQRGCEDPSPVICST
jgi:hypothetical protein